VFLALPVFSFADSSEEFWSVSGEPHLIPRQVMQFATCDKDVVINDFVLQGSGVSDIEPCRFTKMGEVSGEGGLTDEVSWRRIPLYNSTEQVQQKVVANHFLFLSFMNVYWVSENKNNVETLLQVDSGRQLSDLPLAGNVMAAALTLQPGESGWLYIQYQSWTGTRLLLELSTLEDLNKSCLTSALAYGLLYGVFLSLIVVNLLQYRALRNPSSLAYVLQLTAILFYFLIVKGIGVVYLWPEAPRWNSTLLIIASALPGIAMLNFVRVFLSGFLSVLTKKIFSWLIVLYWLSILFALIGYFNYSFYQASVMTLSLLFLPMPILVLWVSIKAYRQGFKPARFVIGGWLAILIFVEIHIALQMVWVSYAHYSQAVMAVGYLLENLFIALAIAEQIRDMRKEKELTQEKLIEQIHARQQESALTAVIEEDKNKAEARADAMVQHLQATSHDLFQPLYSIRLALESLRDDLAKTDNMQEFKHIESTISYIEVMLKEVMQNGEDLSGQKSSFELGELFQDLRKRYKAVAKEQGIRLRLCDSTQPLKGSRLLLFRILDNLLSNALRYTDGGKVLLGARRRENSIEIQVWDTGSGLDPDLLEKLRQPGSHSVMVQSSAGGFGLGLTIVKLLCERVGYKLSVRNTGSGCVFSVFIPL